MVTVSGSTTATIVSVPANSTLCSSSCSCRASKGAYVNYLPIPLVLLTDKLGLQHGEPSLLHLFFHLRSHMYAHPVTIAPAAFEVASAEFPDQIEFWQNSLPPWLKGKLESVESSPPSLPQTSTTEPAPTAQRRSSDPHQRLGPLRRCERQRSHHRWISSFRDPSELVRSIAVYSLISISSDLRSTGSSRATNWRPRDGTTLWETLRSSRSHSTTRSCCSSSGRVLFCLKRSS